MCRHIGIKAMSFGWWLGKGKLSARPRPVRVTVMTLGAALLLGEVSIKPSSSSISRHEDNYDMSFMGALCFGLGGQLVWVSLGAAPSQQMNALPSTGSSPPPSVASAL
jgi:hypothetical protein